MTRQHVSPADDRRWVFNRLAGDYRLRPGYPAPLVERLAALAGPGSRAADLGAGTGHLALPLARAGLHVTAVEPARAMLDALRARAGELGVADLEAVHAAGEETGLPAGAFRLVLVADALHWLDPDRGAREAARLLAPGGVLAVVTPRLASTPFLDALAARLAAANPKARSLPPPVGLFFAVAGLSEPCDERFVQDVPLDDEALAAVIRSLSYAGPALGPAALEALLADVHALARAHGGAAWRRDIVLSWARR